MHTTTLRRISRAILTDCCEAFMKLHPELNDPAEAVGRCTSISEEFLIEYPECEGQLLMLCGYRQPYPSRYYFGGIVPTEGITQFCHTVCVFGADTVVDLTHKQLDTGGPAYLMSNLYDIENQWLAMSRIYGDPITTLLLLVNELPAITNASETIDLLPMSIMRRNLHRKIAYDAYVKLRRYVAMQVLQLTGTESDNIYLGALRNFWPKLFQTALP